MEQVHQVYVFAPPTSGASWHLMTADVCEMDGQEFARVSKDHFCPLTDKWSRTKAAAWRRGADKLQEIVDLMSKQIADLRQIADDCEK